MPGNCDLHSALTGTTGLPFRDVTSGSCRSFALSREARVRSRSFPSRVSSAFDLPRRRSSSGLASSRTRSLSTSTTERIADSIPDRSQSRSDRPASKGASLRLASSDRRVSRTIEAKRHRRTKLSTARVRPAMQSVSRSASRSGTQVRSRDAFASPSRRASVVSRSAPSTTEISVLGRSPSESSRPFAVSARPARTRRRLSNSKTLQPLVFIDRETSRKRSGWRDRAAPGTAKLGFFPADRPTTHFSMTVGARS